MMFDTLAQSGSGGGSNFITTVVYGIGLLVFVWSIVSNMLGNKKKAGNKPSPSRGRRPSLDDIAERRRTQLQEAARNSAGRGARPQASAGGSRNAAGSQPMSMADRIAEAKAQQEASRRAGGGPPEQVRRRGSPPTSPQDAERQRAEVQRERQQAEQVQRQRIETQRREQAARQQRQTREAAERRQQELQRRAAERSRPVSTPQPTAGHGVDAPPHPEVHRMVAETSEPGRRIASSRRRGLSLSRADLRRTIILKEVLDPPVAMRDPRTDPFMG